MKSSPTKTDFSQIFIYILLDVEPNVNVIKMISWNSRFHFKPILDLFCIKQNCNCNFVLVQAPERSFNIFLILGTIYNSTKTIDNIDHKHQ